MRCYLILTSIYPLSKLNKLVTGGIFHGQKNCRRPVGGLIPLLDTPPRDGKVKEESVGHALQCICAEAASLFEHF